ncbi:hypothetical protein [Pseudodesulfovibrio piezophilus]|uniref:hypothetical protein n=1 Tax=Pseudodesulfovibrio piezophilus TaxID=879567 RepID=UPI00034DC2D1|nr:hypothetical protein [Pseudodesulfovibrio piezophilus]
MIWLQHKKYTTEYISEQLADICFKVRQETRRMVVIATSAVLIMVSLQTAYLFELLGS